MRGEEASIVQLFHLALLDALSSRLDRAGCVLSGGAALRYFFDSARHSEVIGFEAAGAGPLEPEGEIEDALESETLAVLLRTAGLQIGEASKASATNSAHRWAVTIEHAERSEPVSTSIALRDQNVDDRFRLEALPSRLVAPHALRPPCVRHCTAEAIGEQSVEALAGHPEAPARDVFDLDLLLRRRALPAGALDPRTLDDAANRTLELTFAEFDNQVLPLLDRDVLELYESEASWTQMQAYVVEGLRAAR